MGCVESEVTQFIEFFREEVYFSILFIVSKQDLLLTYKLKAVAAAASTSLFEFLKVSKVKLVLPNLNSRSARN